MNMHRTQRIQIKYGILTLYDTLFQKIYPGHCWQHVLDYNSKLPAYDSRFSAWAFPASLAVTKGILVIFFSSP